MDQQKDHPDIWQQVRAGDKKAYEEIFMTYYRSLCNYSCSMVREMDEAEEVVQNVFYNLWNKRESLSVESSLKSYLYRAVHNDCLNRIKHRKVRAQYAADLKGSPQSFQSDGAQLLEAKELGLKIQNALAKLPEQCGVVFRMNRFEHLKYAEIASQLGISVKTVENHMGKALKILRGELKEYLHLLIVLLFIC